MKLSTSSTLFDLAVQDDGKVIISGTFTAVNNVPRTNIARLNPNGTVDLTWNPAIDGPVYAIVPSETTVYLGGSFEVLDDPNRFGLVRVSALDGSTDKNWGPKGGRPSVGAIAVSGTNIYVGGQFLSIGGLPRGNIARLSATGSGAVDFNWRPDANGAVDNLLVQSNDIFVAGYFTNIGGQTRSNLAKLSASGAGAADPDWNVKLVPAISSLPFVVLNIALSGDNLYVLGSFTNIGGVAREGLAKLSTLGSGLVDTNWSPEGFLDFDWDVLTVADDALYVFGVTPDFSSEIIKLDANRTGARDTNWIARFDVSPGRLRVAPSGLFAGGNFHLCNGEVALSLARLDSVTGARDRGFNAQAQSPGIVYALARQLDGKVIVGGDFWFAGGLPRQNLARVNRDGTLDPFWFPDANGAVLAIAISATNAFVGGTFQKVGGLNRTSLAKLATLGSDAADPAWDARINGGVVYSLLVSGTNLFVGGSFGSIGGQTNHALAKLDAAGSGDAVPIWQADPKFGVDSGVVFSLALSSTNLFVGGSFTAVNGVSRTNIAKLSALGSGAVDTNWEALIGDEIATTTTVNALAIDGTNFFVGGTFTKIGGLTRYGLAKVNTLGSGAVDPAWTPLVSGSLVQTLVLDETGENLYLGGQLSLGSGFNTLAKSSVSTGAIDPSFQRFHGESADTYPFALLATGTDLYVGGVFALIGRASRFGFAFLPVADAPQLIQDRPTDLYIARNAEDGLEVSHFRIIAISGGTLYHNDGVTPVNLGDFLTVEEGAAGLKFAPGGTVTAVSSLNNTPAGTGTSAASLTMTNSPSPVFKFISAAYSVREGQGNLTVGIRKYGDGDASVQYATSDLSATGGVDYQARGGTLNFSAADRLKNIIIPIGDDFQSEGSEQFAVTMSNASPGALIAGPATATVTIVDNDLAGEADSLTTTVVPRPAPDSSGALTVSLQPTNANGQWRLVGELNWHDGGAVVSGLMSGRYEIEFRPVDGYRQPDSVPMSITSAITNPFLFFYAATTNLETGKLSVKIEPGDVATAANVTLRGQWRRQGGPTNWLNSGDVVSNLNAGSYTVEFKGIPERLAPPPQTVQVGGGNATYGIVGTYYSRASPGARGPSVVPFSTATSDTNWPYLYNGQIQTGIGFGSGFVVKPRVVLTAAHVLFDDVSLTNVTEAHWFFQRYRDQLEPVPQVPRGWYVFEGYTAQRELDKSPGISTPASQNLDVAAIFFLEDAGRGGYGGYLSSDADDNEYLLSANRKFLVGYPLEGVPEVDQGKLHATTPANLRFIRLNDRVFATADIEGFPGNSGGPLYVEADVNKYLPAAIYLGGSAEKLVRAINSEVVDLINRAELSGTGGGNFTGGGVTLLSPGFTAPPFGTGLLTVSVTPSVATTVRPGWRISRSGDTNFITDALATIALFGDAAYPIEFKSVPGFVAPSNRIVQVTVGQIVEIEADYVPLRPSVDFSYRNGLSLRGDIGATYRVDHATNLAASVAWTPLTTITLSSSPSVISNTQPAETGSRFYRAVLVP